MHVVAGTRKFHLSGRRALVASFIGAALTAACAQITIPLPGHPVPITMQVFAVICCGLVLGGRYAALAQVQYLVAGLLGAPIFSFHQAGPAVFVGPTGGYLIGFVFAAYAIGLFTEMARDKSTRTRIIAGLIGVGIIYTFGAAWLAVWSGAAFVGWTAWLWGAAPYAGVDVVKVALAAHLCGRYSK